MQEVKEKIKQALRKSLSELGVEDVEPKIEVPADQKNGDFSSNVALQVFGDSRFKIQDSGIKTPLELAQRVATILESKFMNRESVDRIEAVAPGFINFYVAQKELISNLDTLLKDNVLVAKSTPLHGKKVVVEFTDPNPFKEFHIGHLYSNTIGEALSRLFEAQGASVKRLNYQGDVGMHVAKALYGLGERFKIKDSRFKNIKELEEASLKERVEFLGQGYAFGSKMYEESEEAKEAINKLNKQIYEAISKDRDSSPSVQNDIYSLYTKGRQWSLDYFETIYRRLGTKFDGYYYESEVGERGIKIVSDHIKDGIFQNSEGAVIFPGKNYGLHNRVFINSLGLPTYEAKELGLAVKKYQDYPYDLSVIVTGNEINEYFKVLLKALSLVDPVLAEKTRHVSHGMVRLPSGKMSSRTGTIISGEWLLDEAKKKIHEAYKDMDEDALEKVAIAAVKYSLLKSSVGKDVEFNFEESLSFEGNSGPYLQYTYVRTQSVLTKSKVKSQSSKVEEFDIVTTTSDLEKEEILLLRTLYQFPQVVESAASSLSPSILCGYLFSLAHLYNLFYAQHSILSGANKGFRLALTKAVGKVLKDGLHLLGIEVPERM